MTAEIAPTSTVFNEVLSKISSFVLNRVLNNGLNGAVVVLGHFADDIDVEKPVIIKVNPLPVTSLSCDGNALQELVRALLLLGKVESGSRFSYYNTIGPEFVNFGIDVIYPATSRDIDRHTFTQMHFFLETPKMYMSVVKPSIQDTKNIEWVYNILDGKKEQDRLLYDDPNATTGFILNIDTKWSSHPPTTSPRESWKNHQATKDLYCLAIVRDRSLRNIRDLNGSHVDMLEEILKRGFETIESVYGIKRSVLRVFIHYPPQFNHLHIHFTRIGNEFGCPVEKAHLVTDIIDLLKIDSDIFAKRNLTVKIAENDALYSSFLNFKEE